jgi:hypothetical protein
MLSSARELTIELAPLAFGRKPVVKLVDVVLPPPLPGTVAKQFVPSLCTAAAVCPAASARVETPLMLPDAQARVVTPVLSSTTQLKNAGATGMVIVAVAVTPTYVSLMLSVCAEERVLEA